MKWIKISIGLTGIGVLALVCTLSSHSLHLLTWPGIAALAGWIGFEWKKDKCIHASCDVCEPEDIR
ncbi:hypothetical protein LCGC14_1634630 [marine sediment metagenome]|uniref:Uncharacterized protein n=1 Tax=marine sediment metagenome TaxID=412755 RepID=A0A0F9INW3_9ZZZZ